VRRRLARLLAPCAAAAIALLSAPAAAAPEARPAIEVELEGLADDPSDNVRGHLSIWIYRDSAELAEASVRRLHGRAPDEIRQALQPFGRYAPEVESSLETTPGGWRAVYRVTPGPETHWSAVELAVEGPGADDPAFADVAARLPIKAGLPLRHASYEQAKLALQTLAEDHGYLDARFTESVLEVDPAAALARARLRFATGPRFRFGPVGFEQDVLDPDLVQRYAGFETGDVFSVAKLLEMQYALNDSDYFSLVEIEPLREETDAAGRIPIRVRLAPRPKHKYTFGFGFGTDAGPRATVGVENRRLNAAGHRVSTELQWSEVKQQLEAGWQLPLARPAHERLSFQSRIVREELGDTVGRNVQFGAALAKQLGSWQQTAYLQYKAEKSVVPGAPDERSQLVIPGISWTRTLRDDPVYPTRGYRFVADFRFSHDGIASDATFEQLRMNAKLIRSWGSRTRFIARAELGHTWVDALSDLPVSERFFTGGDQSVRGFDYNTLGPTDADGNVIGGRELAVASLEIDARVIRKWGVAAFIDAGNAADADSAGGSFDNLTLRRAAGVGLRWRSPVGMVRIDVARPIDDPLLRRWRLHISIGPDL
jgi:translocation and assembly module TamA